MRMGYSLPQAYEAVRRKRPEAVVSEEQVEALRLYAESLSTRPAP